MSRFFFIACRVSFLAFSLITFNLVDRTLGIVDKQGAGGSYHHAYIICMEILDVLAPLFMVITSYAMLRLLDSRHRWVLLFFSVMGVTCSTAVEVWTKDNLLLAACLFLIPQIPITLGRNRRADGWPLDD